MRFICPGCSKWKEHHALGRCAACYQRERRRALGGGAEPRTLSPCSRLACEELTVAPDRDLCLDCLLGDLGISYRQLDYWSRKGHLRPGGQRGTGHVRQWAPAELEVAARMARLTAAGIAVETAAAFARGGWPRGEIAPGVVLQVLPVDAAPLASDAA